MKKRIFSLLACLLLTACVAEQNNPNVSFGLGMTGYSTRFVKMDSHAREVAHEYLAKAYKRRCGGNKAKRNPVSCELKRPFFTAGSMPVGAEYYPLPPEVMNRISFIPPGTALVQSGYSVYLIRLPDRIIYDSVSLHPYWKESLRSNGY
jgi:hypothetical protein